MPNKPWLRVAILASAIAFVFYIASLCMPAAYQICSAPYADGTKDCAQHHLGPFVLLSIVGIGDAHNGLLTAIFTGVLTVFTVGLWQETRNSVRIAARALTELERPYLFVFDMNWRPQEPHEVGGLEPGLTYTVANHGKLPAIIRTVLIGIDFDNKIPEHMIAVGPTHDLLTGPIVASDKARNIPQPLQLDDDRGTMSFRLKSGQEARIPTALVLGGPVIKIFIEYDGPITNGHEITSCWRWNGGMGTFAEYGGWRHNKRT